jgi:hypothetical protein
MRTASVVFCFALALMLAGCGEDKVHVRAPFERDAFLVFATEGRLPEIHRVDLGSPIELREGELGEQTYLLSFDAAQAARLHPEGVLADASKIDVYVSEVPVADCPFGEARRAGERAFELPSEAWTVFELEDDLFREVSDGPSWRPQLRLSMPVEAGCGLPSPQFEHVPFPSHRDQAYNELVPVGANRWVGITAFGQALVLLSVEPPGVLAEIRLQRDLGLTDRLDGLNRVVVDLDVSPPIVLASSTKGVFRYRIVGDAFVADGREWAEHEVTDLVRDPSGRIIGVTGSGLVFTSSRADATTVGVTPTEGVRLEGIRATGSSARPYALAANNGRVYLGDPFSTAAPLRSVNLSTRSLKDLVVGPPSEAPSIFILDAGGRLHRLDPELSSRTLSVGFPPELPGCAGATMDPCGFTSVDVAEPRTVVSVARPDADDPRLLIGFLRCSSVVIIEPERGCLSVLRAPELDPDSGTKFPTTTEDAIYYPSIHGPVYRWSTGR